MKAHRLLKEHDVLIKKLNLLKLQFATQNNPSTLKINYYLHYFSLPKNTHTETEFLDSQHHQNSKNNTKFGSLYQNDISDDPQEWSEIEDAAPDEYEEDFMQTNDNDYDNDLF